MIQEETIVDAASCPHEKTYIPTIVLNDEEASPPPHSYLGVWFVKCPDLVKAVNEAFLLDDEIASAHPTAVGWARGRRNINISLEIKEHDGAQSSNTGSVKMRSAIRNLKTQASQTADKTNKVIQEHLSQLPISSEDENADNNAAGTDTTPARRYLPIMSPSTKNSTNTAWKRFSTLRLLSYQEEDPSCPPHCDVSHYTIVIQQQDETTDEKDQHHLAPGVQVMDPCQHNVWHKIPPPPPGHAYLFVGHRWQEACAKRNAEIQDTKNGQEDDSTFNYTAPVHRVIVNDNKNKKSTPRKAAAFHVKGFPLSGLEQEGDCQDFADALLFSNDRNKGVPLADQVMQHWKLLQGLVCGLQDTRDKDDSLTVEPFRLPDPSCEEYWSKQIERYFQFLIMHALYPEESHGMLPPRIIHYIWICHQLQPAAYQADCESMFGKILHHDNAQGWNLHGCTTFHSLWHRLTGDTWPSEAELHAEAISAQEESRSNDDLKQSLQKYTRANLFLSLSSPTTLYEGLLNEGYSDSTAIAQATEKNREQYARFLVASSYVRLANLRQEMQKDFYSASHVEEWNNLTPPAMVDLVWHSHLTCPHDYHATTKLLPVYVDHQPCGGKPEKDLPLVLVDAKRRKDLAMIQFTKDVWKDLYDSGIDLNGNAIFCCSPSAQNPTPDFKLLPGPNVLHWWCSANPNGLMSFSRVHREKRGLNLTFMHKPNFVHHTTFKQIYALKDPSKPDCKAEVSRILGRFQKDFIKLDCRLSLDCQRKIDDSLCCLLSLASVCTFCCWWTGRDRKLVKERMEEYDKLVEDTSKKLKKVAGIEMELIWNCEGPLEVVENTDVRFNKPAFQFRRFGATFPGMTKLTKEAIFSRYAYY